MTFALTQIAAEAIMKDSGRLLRDPEHTEDDTFDRTTWKMVKADGDETTVYEGKASMAPVLREQRSVEGERSVYRRTWQVIIPISASPPRANDRWLVLVSEDTALVGRKLRVWKVNERTHGAFRKFWVEDDAGNTER